MTAPATLFYLSCHCQRNILTYRPANPAEPFAGAAICSCSHCAKRRQVWVGTGVGSVDVVKGGKRKGEGEGEGGLSVYSFGSGKMPHHFCNHCGTHLISGDYLNPDPTTQVAINIRAIRNTDFNLWTIPTLSIPTDSSAYSRAPPPPDAETYLAGRAKHYDFPTEVYNGSCHCKAISFSVLCRPLEEVEMSDCACSICLGNGDVWVFPGRHDIIFHPSLPGKPYQPQPSLVSRYVFGDAKVPNEQIICKSCGCQLIEAREASEDDQSFGGWLEDNGPVRDGHQRSCGVNVAMLDVFGGYHLDMKKLKGYVMNDAWRYKGGAYEIKL